jgi:outer membrane protein TolC
LPSVIAAGMAAGIAGVGVPPAQAAPSPWAEANDLAGAFGGWRVYAQERAATPEGYPAAPVESEALLPAEVMAAEPSVETEAALAAWESRRFAERSASLAPPTLTYARTRAEAESSREVGIHLPVGAWIGRARSLAADEAQWGAVERQALRYQASRNRLALYADAVAAKAELAQAMDRLEVQRVLEELTQRQRDIAAVPEATLLSLRIDRVAAEAGAASARETALQAAERLALELGLPLAEAPVLQRRLPLELAVPEPLPPLETDGRLDVRMAEETVAQQETTLSRAQTAHWLGGLEVGLLQEHSSAGDVANTLELSWRLPIGGASRRQTELGERVVQQGRLQLDAVRRSAQRERAAAVRAKSMAAAQLQQAAAALDDAELWMEEQTYRYSGMLIGPHDVLRAAARLRSVRSGHIAAQQRAFLAAVDAHFVQAIPMRIAIAPSAAPSTAAADAGH